jgi:hypothetical protein
LPQTHDVELTPDAQAVFSAAVATIAIGDSDLINVRFGPTLRTQVGHLPRSEKCHVWTAPAMQEESDVFAKRSGAAMYPAFECSRYGRWP